jgi:hypothetical protein
LNPSSIWNVKRASFADLLKRAGGLLLQLAVITINPKSRKKNAGRYLK